MKYIGVICYNGIGSLREGREYGYRFQKTISMVDD